MNIPYDIQVLLFDLGNVVVEIDIDAAYVSWAQSMGCDAVELKQGFDIDQTYHRYEIGLISTEEFFQHVRDELGAEINDAQILQGWNTIIGKPVSGIDKLLNEAGKHWQLFAFSNTNEAHEAHWSPLLKDILHQFDDVFVSWRLGKRKPDIDAFNHVADLIGVPPHHILFFDDYLENIEGAKSAGFQAAHCTGISDIKNALASIAGK